MRIEDDAHMITVFPVIAEGCEMCDWKCCCTTTSADYFRSFGPAAEAALTHVPDGQQAFVTRPTPTRCQ